jgi:hypothetical protein
VLEKIRMGLNRTGSVQKSVEVLKGEQSGLWGLFEKTIALSWAADATDAETLALIEADVALMQSALPVLLGRFVLHVDNATRHVVHTGRLQGGAQAAEGWRTLFAEALIKWTQEGNTNEQK